MILILFFPLEPKLYLFRFCHGKVCIAGKVHLSPVNCEPILPPFQIIICNKFPAENKKIFYIKMYLSLTQGI